MALIRFMLHDGKVQLVEALSGQSLMEAARAHNVPGIRAECGGSMACATCHVYVAADWRERVGGAGSMEEQLLEGVVDSRPDSRLSCQITVSDTLNGLVVSVPAPSE
jgi:2Fe-2S ferredoxin